MNLFDYFSAGVDARQPAVVPKFGTRAAIGRGINRIFG